MEPLVPLEGYFANSLEMDLAASLLVPPCNVITSQQYYYEYANSTGTAQLVASCNLNRPSALASRSIGDSQITDTLIRAFFSQQNMYFPLLSTLRLRKPSTVAVRRVHTTLPHPVTKRAPFHPNIRPLFKPQVLKVPTSFLWNHRVF